MFDTWTFVYYYYLQQLASRLPYTTAAAQDNKINAEFIEQNIFANQAILISLTLFKSWR